MLICITPPINEVDLKFTENFYQNVMNSQASFLVSAEYLVLLSIIIGLILGIIVASIIYYFTN